MSSQAVTKDQLRRQFSALGMQAGDVVMLHSSLKSLGYVEGGAHAVIEALHEAISPGGTLVVPTYYQPGGTILGTCKLEGYVFDPRRQGSNLGALPSAFLRYPGISRSIHPTHSVSAIGPKAAYVTATHHLAPSIFGEGSPWERCLALDAKILGVGITMGPVTFYHLLEDRVGDDFPLPVKLKDVYALACKDWDGRDLFVNVTPLDPHYMPFRIDAPGRDDLRDYFWREFSRAGLLVSGQVGQATVWQIRAGDFYRHLHFLMESGITIYSTPEQLASRPI